MRMCLVSLPLRCLGRLVSPEATPWAKGRNCFYSAILVWAMQWGCEKHWWPLQTKGDESECCRLRFQNVQYDDNVSLGCLSAAVKIGNWFLFACWLDFGLNVLNAWYCFGLSMHRLPWLWLSLAVTIKIGSVLFASWQDLYLWHDVERRKVL